MTNRIADVSQRKAAKIALFMFLIIFVCGPFSMVYVPSKLIVPGDATATANNLMASESLFRMAIVSDSVVFLSEIVLIVMLYLLLKPISKTLSLIAAFFRLAMAAVQGVNLLNNLAALLLVSGAGYLTVFEPDQLHALVLLFLNGYKHGGFIWELFFGLHCFVLAYLVFKSGYIPRVLGVLLVCASLGYLTDGYGNILFPNVEAKISMISGIFLLPGVIGELSLILWLLFKGTKIPEMRKDI